MSAQAFRLNRPKPGSGAADAAHSFERGTSVRPISHASTCGENQTRRAPAARCIVCAADSRKQPQICPLRAGKNGAVRPTRAIAHPAGILRPHGVPGIGVCLAHWPGNTYKSRYGGRVFDEPDKRNRFAHYLTG